eukprot:Tamp_15283.p1 GENE.Tamp_15283~~Tamp_15283.p1  ORF type:complete len:213 (+),score=33.20 Tamp_15283:377-1015(+)
MRASAEKQKPNSRSSMLLPGASYTCMFVFCMYISPRVRHVCVFYMYIVLCAYSITCAITPAPLRAQMHVRKGDELGDVIRHGQEQIDARERYFSELRSSYEQQLAQFAQQAQVDREQSERAEQARRLAESALEKLTYELHRIRAADTTRREMEEKLKVQVLESSRRLHELQESEDKTRTKAHQTLTTLRDWHEEYFAHAAPSNQEAEQYFLA